jgi:hypothetical protein
MSVTEVRYERLFNTGNYCNQKIGLTATVADGEDAQAILDALRAFVADNDPELVEARAIVANPGRYSSWEVAQAHKRLGLPPPEPPTPPKDWLLDAAGVEDQGDDPLDDPEGPF